MMQIINWCNANQGFIMGLLTLIYVILTLVYVLVTMLILLSSRKSTQAADKQINLLQEQIREQNRPVILAGLKVIDKWFALFIRNEGLSTACNVACKINNEFINLIEENIRPGFREITETDFTLAPQMEISRPILIHIIGQGNRAFDIFDSVPLIVDITYSSSNKQCSYSEKYQFNIKMHRPFLREFPTTEETLFEIKEIIKKHS